MSLVVALISAVWLRSFWMGSLGMSLFLCYGLLYVYVLMFVDVVS